MELAGRKAVELFQQLAAVVEVGVAVTSLMPLIERPYLLLANIAKMESHIAYLARYHRKPAMEMAIMAHGLLRYLFGALR